MKTEGALSKFVTGLPVRFEVSEEEIEFWALLVEVDEKTGRAVRTEQIRKIL